MFILLTTTALAVAATPTHRHRATSGARLTILRDRQVLRFFATHRWLFADPRFSAEARRQVATHKKSLAAARRALARERRHAAAVRERELLAHRRAAAMRRRPAAVICRVFGDYCSQALRVARCESGLRIDARNGEYLGLFQMGADERRLFGHGSTAGAQARAAHRYFVASGRGWGPWSCKPW